MSQSSVRFYYFFIRSSSKILVNIAFQTSLAAGLSKKVESSPEDEGFQFIIPIHSYLKKRSFGFDEEPKWASTKWQGNGHNLVIKFTTRKDPVTRGSWLA